jgi:hypothetical protein
MRLYQQTDPVVIEYRLQNTNCSSWGVSVSDLHWFHFRSMQIRILFRVLITKNWKIEQFYSWKENIFLINNCNPQVSIKDVQLQEKPLHLIKTSFFTFSIYVAIFCPPGSRFIYPKRIRIQPTKIKRIPIRITDGGRWSWRWHKCLHTLIQQNEKRSFRALPRIPLANIS